MIERQSKHNHQSEQIRGTKKAVHWSALKLTGCGQPFRCFECWRVRVMRIPKNSQIRRICISGSLFLFYASLFCKWHHIVLNFRRFLSLVAKIPHRSAGFLPASFLSMQVGGLEGDRTLDLCDANAALSQLSYEPKSALFMRKKLRNLDFSNIQFSGESPTNRTEKQGTGNRVGCASLWMRTVRSPSWATGPNRHFSCKKSCEFWISQIFDFQGKVQQIGLENGEQKIGSDVSRYGCEPCALPAELQALIFTCSLNSSFIIADFFEK